MIFGTPKTQVRWKPLYTHIIRLYWQGHERKEIAAQFGIPESTVGTVINSDQGQVMLSELEKKTFDSTLEVITLAQAAAEQVLAEKIKLALYDPDPRVRSRACSDVLGIAGHTPVHRVSIERPDSILEEYKGKTPSQLRDDLIKLKEHKPNEVGPDGKLVN